MVPKRGREDGAKIFGLVLDKLKSMH